MQVSYEKSLFELVVTVSFGVVVAPYHLIVNQLQLLL